MTKKYTIEQIEKMLTEISPWPYKKQKAYKAYQVCHVSTDEDQSYGMKIPHCDVYGERQEYDSSFFTAAPEIIRSLLDEIKEKDRLLALVEGALQKIMDADNSRESKTFDIADAILATIIRSVNLGGV